MELDPSSLTMATAMLAYNRWVPLRAAMQLLPGLGGAIDTLVSGYAGKIQEQRVQSFLTVLDSRLRELETMVEIEPSEELFDLMRDIFDSVARTRSESKRRRFAELVVTKIRTQGDWDDAEIASRLLTELDDPHIEVLDIAYRASSFAESNRIRPRLVLFQQHDVQKFDEKQTIDLNSLMKNYPAWKLRLICADLLSKGFLLDEGLTMFNAQSMKYFKSTELSDWFMNWISKS